MTRSASPGPWERRTGAWFAAATVVTALGLYLVGALLSVPDGGIEDYLGVADRRVSTKFEVALGSFRQLVAGAYLGLDTMAFVPLYTVSALILVHALLRKPVQTKVDATARTGLVGLVVSLTLVDLTENLAGAWRFGLGSGLIGLGGAGLSWLFMLQLRKEPIVHAALEWAFVSEPKWPQVVAVGVAVASLSLGCVAATSGVESSFLLMLVAGAHHAKTWLVLGTIAVLGSGCLAWAVGLDPRSFTYGVERTEKVGHERAALRAAIGDMLGRSRYVLVALALIGGLLLAMDQARDIVYAMAAPPTTTGWTDRVLYLLGSFGSFGALAVAAGALDFTCWLWTRSVCELNPLGLQKEQATASQRVDAEQRQRIMSLADTFAKYWARILAFLPVAMLISLYARVIRESLQGAPSNVETARPVLLIFVAGVGLLGFGTWLMYKHSTASGDGQTRYYSNLTWTEWAEKVAFMNPRVKRAMGVGAKYRPYFRPQTLPFALCAALFALRLVDVFPTRWLWTEDYLPTMTLPVALLSVAFWLCVFGWLSILEVYQSIPWFALLVVLVVLFGVGGLTDNHRVWLPIVADAGAEGAHLAMLAGSGLLAGLTLGAYYVALRIAAAWPEHDWKPLWIAAGSALGALGVLALGVACLKLFDCYGTSRPVITNSRPPERPSLDAALAEWLTRLFESEAWSNPATASEVPVYFVSTEGGGIRAAVWTAMTLDHFAETDAHFVSRTFSISGVSGGAVGGAVFRACGLEPGITRRKCIERFAKTDMVGPLISAWMFEDVVARVLPTLWCTTPGCGVLSRGAWFEQAMENAAPQLRKGLVATGQLARQNVHSPYLLMNSTWIETGERALASDLSIDWISFPATKDQLQILHADIPLGTAAHNAARFPFTNPIGSVHTTHALCANTKTPLEAGAVTAKPAQATAVCGHLGDGGYFENGGTQSTLDVLRGFAACLADTNDPDAQSYPQCQSMASERKAWLRKHLVPQVLMIRNDPERGLGCSETCSCPALPLQQNLTKPEPNTSCPANDAAADQYTPEGPECGTPLKSLVGVLGPGIAIVKVSGIGANGRLAEARQKSAVRALRGRMGNDAACTARPPVRAVDLHDSGILYPLGWHLSPVAIQGLAAQADKFDLLAPNAPVELER